MTLITLSTPEAVYYIIKDSEEVNDFVHKLKIEYFRGLQEPNKPNSL